jgi:hypothetical protein
LPPTYNDQRVEETLLLNFSKLIFYTFILINTIPPNVLHTLILLFRVPLNEQRLEIFICWFMFLKGVTNRNTWTVTSILDALRDIDFHVREQAAVLYESSGKE